jgi:hypothetical protein
MPPHMTPRSSGVRVLESGQMRMEHYYDTVCQYA